MFFNVNCSIVNNRMLYMSCCSSCVNNVYICTNRFLCVYFYKQPSPPGPVSIPGGGVPLNMKEVEELERMTKDFIKHMDKNAPVITSAPTGTCT